MKLYEVNFDGLVGPTHNYGGLAYGNIASLKHKHLVSNPKQAALQGIEKMHLLHQLGVKQGVLPPQERPNISFLQQIGFSSLSETPLDLLLAASSAASMWAANSATVCPSTDSRDHTVHLTPANLCTNTHRSLEPKTTAAILKAIFPAFTHHAPLPATPQFSDEGAANHTRFNGGVQLFVYGKKPRIFPARQSLEASLSIARLHQLDTHRTLFAEQNPEAIDAGVFHNDVISVGFENIFFYHERAFARTEQVVQELKKMIPDLIDMRVNEHDISLKQAVNTYLFNSQIVRGQENKLVLIAPEECRNLTLPFDNVHFVNLKESMQNGGGPACLRLRVPLNEKEIAQVHSGVLFTDKLYRELKEWVGFHYRDRLAIEDLYDPHLLEESRTALDALTKLLHLGSIYEFQR